jgi:GDP-L-fucose synthase
MQHNSKIFVAGHTGLLGSAILRRLAELGYTNVLTVPRAELDLTDQSAVDIWFANNRPEYVFLAAAQVFGIGANVSGEVILNNLQIQTNVINASHKNNCKKLMFPGSNCVYPKYPKLPITENQLLSGYLEPTSESYAVAKIAGIMLCKHFEKQYGFDYVIPMPCNLYGPNDTFDLEHAHVMPSMINKFITARNNSSPTVTLWGDGSALREFLYADDAADGVIHCMLYGQGIINLAPGKEITLKDLANKIRKITGYTGEIVWDTTKPTGTPAKGLDIARITELNWHSKIDLETGIQYTVNWFENN